MIEATYRNEYGVKPKFKKYICGHKSIEDATDCIICKHPNNQRAPKITSSKCALNED